MIEFLKVALNKTKPLETIGILDIGAMNLGTKEYQSLLQQSAARVVGFEPVEAECNRLNSELAGNSVSFLPYCIGDGSVQKFCLTNYSMTSSLYQPNTELLNLFDRLGELTIPVSEEEMKTHCLDDLDEIDFPVDYIKIDIQGAELQAFQGARQRILPETLVIQTEVEWVPMYKEQPLFSEVETFLRSQGFLLHKIIGFGSRNFLPYTSANGIPSGSQILWSDVIFVRDFTRLNLLTSQQLLKMAVITHEIYQSYDLANKCLIEFDRKNLTSVSEMYQNSIHHKTHDTTFLKFFSQGIEACRQNNTAQAIQYFEAARKLNPEFAPAWFNLGLLTGQLGLLTAAISYLDKAIELDPEITNARSLRNKFAMQLEAKQQQENSENAANQLSKKFNQAMKLQEQSELEAAAALFQEILDNEPNHLPSLYSLGVIAQCRQNFPDAVLFFQRVIDLNPNIPQVWSNLGSIFQIVKENEQALKCYDRALELEPDDYEAMLNRGTLLYEMQRHLEALQTYEVMMQKCPDNSKCLCNRGILLTDFKLFEPAIESFARVVELTPDYNYALGLLCFAKMHACDWKDLENLQQRIIAEVRNDQKACKSLAFMSISNEPRDQQKCAEIFTRHFYPVQPPLWQKEMYHHEKLRIAYVSPDFREHPVAHLAAGSFACHDRNRFETYAFSLGKNDESQMRHRIEKSFDHFFDVRSASAFDIAKMIRELEIDILIDLAGYTADSRAAIFSYRPAPVQVNFLGYSGTLGSEFMDYIIADRHIIPNEYFDCYSEKIVWMPDCYMPTDDKIQIPAEKISRHDYGLPEQGFVFSSFNHDYKISPQVFQIWMRLLEKTPKSVLWLMKLNDAAERNLRREAELAGIDPERIIFATRVPSIEEHLARYRLADLFLDTFPCNAHSTASDVLKAGLPILTCMGKAFSGRVAASLLRALDMPELITTSLEEYENLALKLAHSAKKLKKIKSKLKTNILNSNLFNTSVYCKNLESALCMMADRTAKGLAPESFAVDNPHSLAEKKIAISEPRRLHIGGVERKPGWEILNIKPGPEVDHVGDIKNLEPFADETFELVYGSHVLEHVSQSEIVSTLSGIRRILAPKGRLLLSVPDLDVLCRLFLEPELEKTAKFHVMRMMFGGQTDAHDFHHIGFNEVILKDYLAAAGFKYCQRVEDFGIFSDTSSFRPYANLPISLNMIAFKNIPE